MSKEILFGSDARSKMKSGVDLLANAVKVTFGAGGRTVIISNQYGEPDITKDGATVAKAVSSDDTSESIGVELIKGVAVKTAELAGDGTTTATILTQSIVNQGFKMIEAGANPVELKKGIDLATKVVIEELKKRSIEVDNKKLVQIASVSANGDEEIGALIGEAFAKIGKEGIIDIETSNNFETSIDIVQGMNFDRGFISPYFKNKEQVAELENCCILIVDRKINLFEDIVPIMEKSIVDKKKPLLIIAEDVVDHAIASLVVNRMKNGMPVVAVKSPGFGDRRKDILEDIAILTGGRVISAQENMTKLELKDLGQAKKVVVDKNNTSIIKGKGIKTDVDKRVQEIKKLIATETIDYDKSRLEERLAKITGGVAVIYVGAPTDLELKEKKDRVEDAVRATKGAILEGIVAGGGTTLIRCAKALKGLKMISDDQNYGVRIIERMCEEPLTQLCINAGLDQSYIVRQVKEGDKGYNLRTDKFEDLEKTGVIDAAKVIRVALENASSVASMMLISECSIASPLIKES